MPDPGILLRSDYNSSWKFSVPLEPSDSWWLWMFTLRPLSTNLLTPQVDSVWRRGILRCFRDRVFQILIGRDVHECLFQCRMTSVSGWKTGCIFLLLQSAEKGLGTWCYFVPCLPAIPHYPLNLETAVCVLLSRPYEFYPNATWLIAHHVFCRTLLYQLRRKFNFDPVVC